MGTAFSDINTVVIDVEQETRTLSKYTTDMIIHTLNLHLKGCGFNVIDLLKSDQQLSWFKVFTNNLTGSDPSDSSVYISLEDIMIIQVNRLIQPHMIEYIKCVEESMSRYRERISIALSNLILTLFHENINAWNQYEDLLVKKWTSLPERQKEFAFHVIKTLITTNYKSIQTVFHQFQSYHLSKINMQNELKELKEYIKSYNDERTKCT